jgi:hypothetical protein
MGTLYLRLSTPLSPPPFRSKTGYKTLPPTTNSQQYSAGIFSQKEAVFFESRL